MHHSWFIHWPGSNGKVFENITLSIQHVVNEYVPTKKLIHGIWSPSTQCLILYCILIIMRWMNAWDQFLFIYFVHLHVSISWRNSSVTVDAKGIVWATFARVLFNNCCQRMKRSISRFGQTTLYEMNDHYTYCKLDRYRFIQIFMTESSQTLFMHSVMSIRQQINSHTAQLRWGGCWRRLLYL